MNIRELEKLAYPHLEGELKESEEKECLKHLS